MKRVIFLAIVLAAGALSVTACGGDDDDDDSADGGGGSGGNGGSGGSGGNTVECTPSEDTVCQNEQDCPSVVSGDAREAAGECGLGCLQDDNPDVCTVTCIATDTGMTAECSTCYAVLVGCARDNCLTECSADSMSAACTECQIDAGCRDDFDDCSGLMTAP